LEILFLLIGAALAAGVAYAMWRQAARAQQARMEHLEATHQARLQSLEVERQAELARLREEQAREIQRARADSVARSRATLKGHMAEQMAPLLQGFPFLPAEARFLGDPVDYVVFRGYTAVKDTGQGADEVEIVIVDIKQGGAQLSTAQRAIARAAEAGRVRFDVVRVGDDGVETMTWRSRRAPVRDIPARLDSAAPGIPPHPRKPETPG
jgi:predicted Holliday junction resolvase-like endonuclease